jgi:hypothetical protein
MTVGRLEGASRVDCSSVFTEIATPGTLDTFSWGLANDDCDRYLTDNRASLGRINPFSDTERCVNAGTTCAVDSYVDHALFEDLVL